MIYVRTCAYNAEKTLKRAIESILSQTYRDFLFYILDNGSTDGTREIIRDYAERDERIIPFYSDRNLDRSENFEFWNLIDSLSEDDYICFLDADDAYDSSFLEESLRFLTENELDMVMCGSVFMEAESWTPYSNRVVSKNMILKDKAAFENNFPEIYWNLRAMWGKLYTAKAKCPYSGASKQPEWYPVYGGDTINVFESVVKAERIGILAKPLHYYSVSNKSTSYKWHDGREKSDPLLFEKAEELLLKKCGRVSEENKKMLYAVYFYATKDTMRVLFHADMEAEKKLAITETIFFHPITQAMFCMRFDVSNEERIDFFVNVVINLISLYVEMNGQSYEIFERIFSNINPDFSKLIAEEQFKWYIEKRPVLMRNMVLREYEYAINNLIVYLSECGDKISVSFPYLLGQKLSAMMNEEKKYIFFSKKLIRWYILNNQHEIARNELIDWLQLLPEDEEIKALQKLYEENQQEG
ncbi:MAG: glycosyltransferase family 2 protein [Lachnospiraceae bacterium]|nr:glycosyltransferase family 2 protein [Lachnospiraceae bacterium]